MPGLAPGETGLQSSGALLKAGVAEGTRRLDLTASLSEPDRHLGTNELAGLVIVVVVPTRPQTCEASQIEKVERASSRLGRTPRDRPARDSPSGPVPARRSRTCSA